MNSSRFLIFYVSLWYSHYVANVESAKEKALIFNVRENKLMEIDRADDTSKCARCLTACAASPDSEEQKKINEDISTDENAVFLQKVYNFYEDARNIELDICEKTPIPSIVWDELSSSFAIGYEMFYDVKKILLSCSLYDTFRKVINGEGEQTPDEKELPENEFVKGYKDEENNSKFKLLSGSEKILGYYWMEVIAVAVSQNGDQREITFTRDVFNDFFQKNPSISRCENYFFGAWQIPESDESLESDESEGRADEITMIQIPQQQSIENRLEKTPILPMQMFHTFSARLATCMYKNIAFIWDVISNGILKEVDLLIYSMYRLWPDKLTIRYAVIGQNREISSDTIASEHKLFLKHPIPEIIYRTVEWRFETSPVYMAVVVIHNNIKPVPQADRICPEPIKGWNITGNENTAIGTTYACPVTRETIAALKISTNKPVNALDLKAFPYVDPRSTEKKITPKHRDETRTILDEINRHKGIKTEQKKSRFFNFNCFGRGTC